jgi:hypothetical protein
MTYWRTPELDEAAARALAVVTLYAAGTDIDTARASRLLDEFSTAPDGVSALVGGLVSVCESLLVLLEFDTSAPSDVSLHRLGQLIAQASWSPAPRSGAPTTGPRPAQAESAAVPPEFRGISHHGG